MAENPDSAADTGDTNPASESVLVESTVPLANELTSQLGITTGQAEAGAGSIFRLAQNTMDEAQFTQLSASVPGIQTLLTANPLAEDETSGNGGEADSRSASGISGQAVLSNDFDQFGMAPGMVGRFVRVIAGYLRASGDENSAVLLEQIVAKP